MYAVFRSGGKQYRVSKGEKLKLEKLDTEVGKKVVFDQVLSVGEGKDINIGTPYLTDTTVEAKVLEEGKNKKIEVIWDSVVKEIHGNENPKKVKGISINNKKTKKSKSIDLDGVFIAIGHDPATQLFKDQLDMDKEGYLATKPDSTETNIPGVFAAGDVKDKIFRQAVTAAGMGCMAALEAEKFLSH